MGKSPDQWHCIAVDMGASSVRIMLGTFESGLFSHREVHRIANGPRFYSGHDRWEMGVILREILSGIRKAWELSDRRAASVGIDGWGVDFALVDREGGLLSDPVSYRDGRTAGMQELWEKEMSAFDTFRRTGINFYPFNTLFQLLSMRGSPELERAGRLLFLPSYVNFVLTGHAANELTIASTSQMLQVEGNQWDPVILERLGVGEELAGQVIPPGYRLGEITHPELPDTGMELVAVSGHDTACVVAAVPSEGTDHVYISAGTWCIVGIESASALLTEEAFRTGFTNERGAGNTYRLLKNIVGLWLVQGLKKELKEEAGYEVVEQLALRVEPGLLINPEDPLFYHPGRMRDAFDAFFQRTGQGPATGPGAYFRCAYQSLGCSIRQHIELLERLTGRSFRTIHMVGGGSQSDFLNQLIADVTNRPVMAGPVEAAVTGNILNQAVSMGIVEDMETGRKIVGTSYMQKHYVPGPGADESHRLYDRYLTMIK